MVYLFQFEVGRDGSTIRGGQRHSVAITGNLGSLPVEDKLAASCIVAQTRATSRVTLDIIHSHARATSQFLYECTDNTDVGQFGGSGEDFKLQRNCGPVLGNVQLAHINRLIEAVDRPVENSV